MSFEVFSSSAGSGKTFTLVKEYLKIVLADPTLFRHILAITFTNKAANEMKSRIISSLTLLASPPGQKKENEKADLISRLCEEIPFSPEQIKQRSQKVLALILHHYSDFAVTTIDSFVYRILRTFAYDLQLPVDFDVELDSDRLIAKAVDLLISKAGTDEQITRLLVGFTEYKASEEYQWQIEDDLRNFSENLITEDGYDKLILLRKLTLEDFFSLRNQLFLMIRKFADTLSGKAKSILTLIEQNGISSSSFYYHDKGFYGFVYRIAQRDFEKLIPGTYVTETVDNGKWCSPSAPEADRKAILSIHSELIHRYRDMILFADAQKQNFVLHKLLFQHIYPLALLNEIETVITELRQQTGSIHISEFNKRIAAIVMNEPIPFIYERLGEKFKHYLIDEFQDTSVLQWHNLLPLVDNSLASDHFNMVVGDPKQSIYRWRNGEVEQFIQLPKIFRRRESAADIEREKALERHFQCNSLNINYRSGEGIVHFNNSFFRYIRNLLPASLMRIYADVEQNAISEKPGGYVHIGFFEKQLPEEDFGPFNLRRVAEIIDEVSADHYPLSQIAILCRSNKDASELARYLLENGKQVISSESLLLKNAPEIIFLTALLTYLNNPDPLLELTIIRYLHHNGKLAGDEWELCLVRNKKGNEYDPRVFFVVLQKNGFDLDTCALIRLPIYEMVESLVRIFSPDEKGNPFIQFFLDAVLDFSSKTGNDLNEFLIWWEEKKETLSIIAPQGSEAVQIMTIHKAKGLQFPVVIYPFADEALRMTKRFVWVDVDHPEIPQLKTAVLKISQKFNDAGYQSTYEEEYNKSFLDMVNLLYVVMTRASQRLYVITRKPAKDNPPSVPAFFYHYLVSNSLLLNEKLTYETGKKVPWEQRAEMSDQSVTEGLPEFGLFSNDWRQNARLRLRAPQQWDIENADRTREWGNLVHLVLAETMTHNDIPWVTASLLTSGMITERQKIDLDELVTGLIEDPQIKDFFSEGLTVKTESEILHPSGLSYRPDRLVLTGDKAIVIDYKTGAQSPDHHQQLQFYGKLLQDIGFQQVELFLIYLDEEISLVRVN